jgi:hypothetical protein
VWSLRKTSDNDRSAAGVGPDPQRAINRHMEMPVRGDTSRACTAFRITPPPRKRPTPLCKSYLGQ